MRFKYKGYLVEICNYGFTGTCTKLYEEYTQKIMFFSFKRKKFLILSANLWHVASFNPISNEMAIEFAECAIEKLNKLNKGNDLKIHFV